MKDLCSIFTLELDRICQDNSPKRKFLTEEEIFVSALSGTGRDRSMKDRLSHVKFESTELMDELRYQLRKYARADGDSDECRRMLTASYHAWEYSLAYLDEFGGSTFHLVALNALLGSLKDLGA